jgi:hypothetical protein
MSYQVNITLSAGTTFNQLFYMTNPDKSPMDITGASFSANLAKHSRSVNAVQSSSTRMVYQYIPFKTRVVDGRGGVFEISMDSYLTAKLQEGKYMYDAVMKDVNGYRIDAVNGLVFVNVAMGLNTSEILFDGGGSSDGGDIVLDGGSSINL